MQRVTLANALKVLFAVYAVYAAIVSLPSLVRYSPAAAWLGTGRALLWVWAGLAVCLLPVAWGLVREKKWAWNAAVGLLIFGLVVSGLETARICFLMLHDASGQGYSIAPYLRWFAIGAVKPLVLLTLLILARRSYQTAFGTVATGSELKRNSYVRPVALGMLFLMIGGLMFLHPVSGEYSQMGERVVGLVLAGILGAGAPLCFFERRAKIVRRLGIVAVVTAVLGLAVSMTLYTYFAIEGLCVSGFQLVLSIAAVVIAAKARQSFVD